MAGNALVVSQTGNDDNLDGADYGADDENQYVPEGFKDVEEYLKEVVEEFMADAAYDRLNREAALEDLQFVAGDQWDPVVMADRKEKGRPCLTINVLPQFIGQVIGDRRINSTSIKVRPRKDATQELADTRSGLIKSIEAYSRAERVYDAACEDQVTCGISAFRIDLDYAENDVFEQDIFIRHIPNPLAVIWDRMSIDPTGRDAGHCFVQDIMPRKVYEAKWPEHPCPSELGDDMVNTITAQGWFDKDVVRVTEYWKVIERTRELALTLDGKTIDITDLQEEEYSAKLYVDPATGKPRIRKAIRTYAQMHLITGFAILEGPYELPITRLPIIKVEGRVVRVGDDRTRYGLVRFAKDAQRLKNYWRSVSAETLAMAPKAQWISPDDAVEGRQDDFRAAHTSGDPLLVYNKNASAPPQRVMPAPIPAAVLQEAAMNQQDIKDTTGLQDASLGVRSNEVSGKAINARQREGDVATVIYHDNLNNAIQEGGDVINQLIPIAYDTVRTARVIGNDDKHKLIKVNDPNDPESPDLTIGKYDISIETGPSYTTQRMEAADAMMQAIQVAPELMQVAGDLIVKSQDWPGAFEIAERLKKTIPQNLLADDDPQKQKPDAQAEQAQQMQQQMAMAQLQDAQDQMQHAAAMRQAELAEAQAKIEETAARTRQALAQADEAEAQAQKARAEAHKADVDAELHPIKEAQAMDHAERTTAARIKQMTAPKPAAPNNRGAGPRPGADRGKPAAQPKG